MKIELKNLQKENEVKDNRIKQLEARFKQAEVQWN